MTDTTNMIDTNDLMELQLESHEGGKYKVVELEKTFTTLTSSAKQSSYEEIMLVNEEKH